MDRTKWNRYSYIVLYGMAVISKTIIAPRESIAEYIMFRTYPTADVIKLIIVESPDELVKS